MGEGFLGQGIQRVGRNSLLVGVVGLALMALFFWVERRYYYNFFHGPFSMDQATLLSTQNPETGRKSFFTIQGDKTLETGFEETETDYFITSHHPMLVLQVGDRLLLVKASQDTEETQFSGELTTIPSDVQSQVLSVLEQRHPEAKAQFLPVMLDATNYRLNGYLGLLAGVVFGLGFGWLVLKGLQWSAKPETHPVWKKLCKYGSAKQVGAQLEAELRNEGGGETFGSAHLTTNWLTLSSPYAVEVMRLTDIVWAYPHVVKHYHSGIPTGKSHFVKVFDREGATMMISAKKKAAPELLLSIERRVPWATYGFSADLEQMWKKRRSEFLISVDQRKRKVQSFSADAKPAANKKELVRA